ncbi:MAG TPA: hypothetical protein VMV50_02175 [Candidatus Paceibacterota bacterium]|nr:hypothetical protein [Candidatus Paceibacterota bacterium]
MDINKFPNPKLDLPEELRDSANKAATESFAAVENYLNSVGEYIYTNINLDYQRSDPKHIHAWIQRIISANVLRSLYLRNAFVEAFNSRNTVGIFLPLKAWFEVVGALASILDLLESGLSANDLFEKLQPYALGNRGKGKLRVGTTDAVNVATMMEKADKYIEKMRKESAAHSKDDKPDNFFTDFYDVASNPSHPSFDANGVVGVLQYGGIWHAKEPDEVNAGITEELPGYGALLMAPLFVENICQKISKIEAEHFSSLGSPKFFEEK